MSAGINDVQQRTRSWKRDLSLTFNHSKDLWIFCIWVVWPVKIISFMMSRVNHKVGQNREIHEKKKHLTKCKQLGLSHVQNQAKMAQIHSGEMTSNLEHWRLVSLNFGHGDSQDLHSRGSNKQPLTRQAAKPQCHGHSCKMSHLMTKQTKWPVRPVKTQISLGIRPVW